MLNISFLMLQETFDAGLQAFQQEGIANITALKDQLLAAKHIQSKAIEVRHASLMKRWNQLLANSAARKKKLLEAQEHFRKVSHQTTGLQKSHCYQNLRLGPGFRTLFGNTGRCGCLSYCPQARSGRDSGVLWEKGQKANDTGIL